jgi:hypothetical protein
MPCMINSCSSVVEQWNPVEFGVANWGLAMVLNRAHSRVFFFSILNSLWYSLFLQNCQIDLWFPDTRVWVNVVTGLVVTVWPLFVNRIPFHVLIIKFLIFIRSSKNDVIQSSLVPMFCNVWCHVCFLVITWFHCCMMPAETPSILHILLGERRRYMLVWFKKQAKHTHDTCVKVR